MGKRGVDEPPDLGRHDQPVLKARVRLDGIVGHAVDLVATLAGLAGVRLKSRKGQPLLRRTCRIPNDCMRLT